MRRRISAIVLLLMVPAAAWCQEQKKQPPPEFSGGYLTPNFTTPSPRADIFSSIDVIVLLAALCLATFFVLYKRSRTELRVVLIFSLLYFGFYRHGCVCSIGAIQNVALAAGGNGYALPFAAGAFFLLPLLFALFVGRVFCAGVCPLGAIQDVVLLRPKRVPVHLDHALGLLPYAYLGIAVLFAYTGSAFLICQYDPFIAFFRLGGGTTMVTFGAALLLLGTVIGRPYCRFLCPYGVLLRWLAPFGRRRVTITPDRCTRCHLCADACPFGAIKPPVPEMDSADRVLERKRLGMILTSLPAIVGAAALIGYLSGPAMSRLNPDVPLARRVLLEEQGRVKGQTDPSRAVRNQGTAPDALYRQALAVRRRFEIGGALLGGWIGLVVSLKLISVTMRRGSEDYVADPASCLSCARCYSSCPIEQERIQLLPESVWREQVGARNG